MEVLINNRQNRFKISPEKMEKEARTILNVLDCPDGELSILIVDDARIEVLNKKYLSRSGPTNVIAFPMREGGFSNINPQILGDVVISIETAHRESKEADINLKKRFTQLLVHGILHLFGYDHEKTEQEAFKMEKKSNEIIELLK